MITFTKNGPVGLPKHLQNLGFKKGTLASQGKTRVVSVDSTPNHKQSDAFLLEKIGERDSDLTSMKRKENWAKYLGVVALGLSGIALIVFGIFSLNIFAVLAGMGLCTGSAIWYAKIESDIKDDVHTLQLSLLHLDFNPPAMTVKGKAGEHDGDSMHSSLSIESDQNDGSSVELNMREEDDK